jgi:hypothetical protein
VKLIVKNSEVIIHNYTDFHICNVYASPQPSPKERELRKSEVKVLSKGEDLGEANGCFFITKLYQTQLFVITLY